MPHWCGMHRGTIMTPPRKWPEQHRANLQMAVVSDIHYLYIRCNSHQRGQGMVRVRAAKKVRVEAKTRGVYEHPSGSEVWWIHYYADGQRHREKVGRKSAAIALYQTRKADATAGRKLPTLRNTRGVTVSDLIDLALEATANHKDS